MLRKQQPIYEVGFLERDETAGILGRRWVSAAVSGFAEGPSRYQQIEEILGRIGTPVIGGHFMMRRMRKEEVQTLLKKNEHTGGTRLSHTRSIDGLTARISYPQEEGKDLARIRDGRTESIATSLSVVDMVRKGEIESFGLHGGELGMVTPDNVNSLTDEILAPFPQIYAGGRLNAGPAGSEAAGMAAA